MQQIRVGASEYWLDANQVIRVRNLDKNASHTIEAAREGATVIARLTGGRMRHPMLLDLTIPSRITPEAQAYYASPEGGDAITALAIITPNTFSRVIGNIILGSKRPTLPMKLFESEVRALVWLQIYSATGREVAQTQR